MTTLPRPRHFGLPLLVVAGVLCLVGWSGRTPQSPETPSLPLAEPSFAETVAQVDRLLEQRWQHAGVVPAEPADDLTLLRRLSLVLHGTIPSLEEIRAFEADDQPGRVDRWTLRMLADRRFGDCWAERFSRVLAGSENGQFVLFRRDRFNAWLSEQIRENQPYDSVVRELIAGRGLWTDRPATNFTTAAVNEETLDANKLAGRTVRAFLGQRIDCAQCHNHPFAEWKQKQFEGLAACFASAHVTVRGIQDDAKRKFEINDGMTPEPRTVEPAVPFHPEWRSSEGTSREQLAAWVTHPENRRFERAITNRVWGLTFGRAWISPVDDLPNPPATDSERDVLDVLGADFRANGCNLQRLVRLVTATRVFRLASSHREWEMPATEDSDGAPLAETSNTIDENWAVFPMTRLRPDQMIGAMLQAASVKTVDQNSHLALRIIRYTQEMDFVRDYGDLGDDELVERAGTIPQALLRMNGSFSSDMSALSPVSASGRIAAMAPDDPAAVDACYLTCLTRRPTATERDYFVAQLCAGDDEARGQAIQDLYWTLFNAAEFCWLH